MSLASIIENGTQDINTIFTIICTFISGGFFAYIQLRKLPSKKKQLREDYEVGKEFLLNNKWLTMNDLLLEKAYLAFSGRHLDSSILRFFLPRKDVSNKLYHFNDGREFLDIKRNKNYRVIDISLKKSFQNNIRYNSNIIMAYFLYVFFASCSMIFPLGFYDEVIKKSGWQGIIMLVGWFLFFFILGFSFLVMQGKLKSAKKLTTLLESKG